MERMNNSLEGFGAVVTGNGLSEFRLWTEQGSVRDITDIFLNPFMKKTKKSFR